MKEHQLDGIPLLFDYKGSGIFYVSVREMAASKRYLVFNMSNKQEGVVNGHIFETERIWSAA